MRKFLIRIVVGGASSMVLAAMACGPNSAPTSAVPESAVTPPDVSISQNWPATNAASLLAYLEEVDYQSGWPLWPGFGEKYISDGGHSKVLTTYVNQPALAAVIGKKGVMPPNAIIVKENYSIEEEFQALTVMYKVEGYDPENNNWFYLKVLPDGTVTHEGRDESCQACHRVRATNDFIWTGGPASLSE